MALHSVRSFGSAYAFRAVHPFHACSLPMPPADIKCGQQAPTPDISQDSWGRDMSIDHAVVWLEFRTAKVFLFEDTATLSVAGEPEFIRDKRLTHDGRKGQPRDDDFFKAMGALQSMLSRTEDMTTETRRERRDCCRCSMPSSRRGSA